MKCIVLVVDVHNICYRMYYALGRTKQSAIYGFLREILSVSDRFHPIDQIAFCFDAGVPLRKNILPSYKAKRQVMEEKDRKAVYAQIRQLRMDILPYLGFQNIFIEDGYEADDLIASIVKWSEPDTKLYINSNDKDLYQLLDRRVYIIRKGKDVKVPVFYTVACFKEEYHIRPKYWPLVKAIAGCVSDNIPGIGGIGEKTASRFLYDKKLVPEAKRRKIEEAQRTMEDADMKHVLNRNLALTTLPYFGTPKLELQYHEKPSRKKWLEVLRKHGLQTLNKYV